MARKARDAGSGRISTTWARDQSSTAFADRLALGLVAVEQACRRPALDGGGQLPAQVHGVADPQVQALAAQRRVDVGGVAGQQHAALAVARGLARAVGPGAGAVQGP
jgi:hypothetical protein